LAQAMMHTTNKQENATKFSKEINIKVGEIFNLCAEKIEQ
jgi:hypothetical protein